MGDFNVDLLHYETRNQRRDLLDKMFSVSLKPILPHLLGWLLEVKL